MLRRTRMKERGEEETHMYNVEKKEEHGDT